MIYNIVCLKWGTKYGPEYVNRLYKAVKRHTTLPVELHCFTDNSHDVDHGVIIHPLPFEGLSGWWNKLFLFSGQIGIPGRVLFIDLDTLITGNIDHILQIDEGFVVLRDFYTGYAKSITTNDAMGSGLMSFDVKAHTHIWESFIVNPTKNMQLVHPHGDQKWVELQQTERLYWQDLFPGQIVSFKVHCRDGLANDARIVCYHGRPSIPESITTASKTPWWPVKAAPWVADHWKD